MSQMSGARPSPSAPRFKTAKPLATQAATWFQAIFKTKEYNLSQIKGCLMVEIEDLLQNMSQLLSERTKVELLNTKDNDLAKVDILFKTIDSRPGDIQLLSSFCRELARLVGIRSMLRFKLDADDSDYEEILARELLGSSGAAYRREGLRHSIAQFELTARAHLYSGTSSKAGRVNENSARVGRRNEHLTLPRRPGAASDSEAAAKHSNFDSAPETMLLRDITFTEELGNGTTFFVHSAKHRGRPVIVKVFNATANPRQATTPIFCDWKEFLPRLLPPNLSHINRVPLRTDPSERRWMQTSRRVLLSVYKWSEKLQRDSIIYTCNALRSNALKSRTSVYFFDSDQKFLIALDPTALDEAPSSSSPVDIDILWRYFNELCEFVFMSANRLIHDDIDNVKRDADRVELSNRGGRAEGPTGLSETNPRNLNAEYSSVDTASSMIPPRREYAWRKSDRGDQTLALISQRLRLTGGGRASAVRRLHVEPNAKTLHRCVGCRRDEITIATTSRDSAILSYDSPSAREICIVCHQEVDVDAEGVGLCVICQDEEANIAIVDCGHLAMCRSCSELVMQSTRECPLCRTPIVTEARLLRILKT